MKIIGLTGPIGSGKDTVCDIIRSANLPRLTFSSSFKAALVGHVSRAFGVSESLFKIRTLKDTPEEKLFGKTPRQVLQYYGTDFARNLISEDIWVSIVRQQIRAVVASSNPCNTIVITDVRFDNEAEMIIAEGGSIWQIYRPDNPIVSPSADHAAESGVSEHLVTETLYNTGDLAYLTNEVHTMLGVPPCR